MDNEIGRGTEKRIDNVPTIEDSSKQGTLLILPIVRRSYNFGF